MKDHEYSSFVDLIKKLSLNFKGNIDDGQIRVYFDGLKKFKLSAIDRGVDYLITNRKFPDFPVAGCIKKAIEQSRLENGE